MINFSIDDFEERSLPTEEEIKKNWAGDEGKALVSIICTSYNHKQFLENTIKGFLIQKTNFPFEIVLHDDASDDGSSELILSYYNRYKSIVRPVLQSCNQYTQGKSIFAIAISFAIGKYVAICEGDDFWIDEKKLASQVSLLEKSQAGLVYSQAYVCRHDMVRAELVGNSFDGDSIFYGNPIPTLTTVFKRDEYLRYIERFSDNTGKWMMEDYPIWLWFYINSSILFFEKPTSVYRVLDGSASRPLNAIKKYKFNLSSFEIADFFAQDEMDLNRYTVFQEKRNLYLYLYCVKNGLLDEARLHVRKLQSMNMGRKSRMILLLMNTLNISLLVKFCLNSSLVLRVIKRLY